jgi:hypothetical protein
MGEDWSTGQWTVNTSVGWDVDINMSCPFHPKDFKLPCTKGEKINPLRLSFQFVFISNNSKDDSLRHKLCYFVLLSCSFSFSFFFSY